LPYYIINIRKEDLPASKLPYYNAPAMRKSLSDAIDEGSKKSMMNG